MKPCTFLVLCALILPPLVHAGDTWPGWRGPTGQGFTDEKNLPSTWGGPKNEHILWKSPLPGTSDKAELDHNQSSPIVWKDRVFLISVFWPRGVPQTDFPEHRLACYAADDGKLLWNVQVPPGPWRLKDLRGGYSAPTPCTDGKRVYALFGSSVLAAVDFHGKLHWRKEITPHAWDVAVGTSPILVDDSILVLADGIQPAVSRLLAFDRDTGAIRWTRKRPGANFNHTTPLPIEVGGKRQLLIASSDALQGVDPADGAVIWSAKNRGDVTTPVFADGLVYCDDGRGRPGIAVDPTGTGDVTSTRVKWRTGPIPTGFSSPIIAGGFLYRAHNPGVLRCFELASGKEIFAERLPPGVSTSASPILTADRRLLFASAGVSLVLPVGPEFRPLAVNDLGDPAPCSPAVAAGRLYLRGTRYLYCIGVRKPAP